MKRVFILLLALSLCLQALAEGVSQSNAMTAAANFFNGGPATRGGAAPQLVWTGEAMTRSPYMPPFYVFNNPEGGWVVISGENTVRPVLAWSAKGSFQVEGMPGNVAGWFEDYADQISWARANGIAQSEEASAEWAEILSGRIIRKATQVKMLSDMANWGQGNPYNLACPMSGSTRTVTGCVATAGAIIMRHYQYPVQGSHGTGNIGGYEDYIKNSSETAPTIDLDSDSGYEWANMPMTPPYSDSEKEAIAKLMYHVGLSVEMEYGPSASSGQTRRLSGALVNNFGFDPSIRMIGRKGYTQSEWLSIFKDELDADRPIVISASTSTNSGHAFVAQGYDSDDNIYLNWGWGGTNNGYFSINAFRVNNEYDFRYSQAIMVGIKPNAGGQPSYSLALYRFSLSDGEPTPSSPNTRFRIIVQVLNRGGMAVPCTLSVYVTDYAGAIQAESSTTPLNTTISSSSISGWNGWGCDLRNRTAPLLGDKLMVCYRDASGSVIPLTDQDGSYRNSIPLFDIPFISVKNGGQYNVGDYFDFEIVNTRTVPNDMEVIWYFDGNQITPDTVTGQACRKLTSADVGTHTVKAVVTISGETRTMIQKIKVN